MDNSFKNVIEQSKSVLILLPTKPYFDQVAAGLGLYLSLRDKKDVQVYSPSPMTVEFNRLVGVNRVTQDLGNKNLIIRFTDYKATDIERVSYDIENGQFRLTVIPKQKINPPIKDQVELSYSGVTADTVIMIGGANESHFPALTSKDLVGANIIHVGTRDISLSSNKTYVSFAKPASSVSEIIASLIKESALTMDEDIATNLLMGIEEASNNFTDPGASAETFAIVSELMRLGGRRLSQQAPIRPTSYPSGTIPNAPMRTFQYPQVNSQPQQLQPAQQLQPVQPIQSTQAIPEPNVENQEEPVTPKDWLTAPKIYKGTS